MNDVGVTEVQTQLLWQCFNLLSHPTAWPPFFWQWGSSHLHLPGRSYLSDLQGRVVIIRVFIELSSPTVLAVTSQK